MKWQIPAKTFLLGEYAAVAGSSAIVLTTTPSFEIEIVTFPEMEGIHPESPAGRWWAQQNHLSHGLVWRDPYQGVGGVGASSAQFLGAFLASCYLSNQEPSYQALLDAYYQSAWDGQGLRPSGYDVIAQSQHDCVYINRHLGVLTTYEWPFEDIGFLLLHSGQKLATHHHLQKIKLPDDPEIKQLSDIVLQAKLAMEEKNSHDFISAINDYQKQLALRNLTAVHTLQQINTLKSDVLAVKGCGAMGADVLLLIIPSRESESQIKKLKEGQWNILAGSHNIYKGQSLIKNNSNGINNTNFKC